jgi:cell wall-associated NlpC family hydrolase
VTLWLPGDFAVVHSRAFVGQAIARMQAWSGATDPADTGWVHAIMGVEGGMIVEAEPGGAVKRPMHYDDADVYWSSGRLGDLDGLRSAITINALAAIGTPYSFADYAALAAHQWHWPLPGLHRFVASSGHMICSQLVDWCYAQAGYHLFADGRWPGYVRPVDLAEKIRAPAPTLP